MSIIDPVSNNKFSIFGKNGRELLKKYIAVYMHGGSEYVPGIDDEILEFYYIDAKHDLNKAPNILKNFTTFTADTLTKFEDDRLISEDIGDKIIGYISRKSAKIRSKIELLTQRINITEGDYFNYVRSKIDTKNVVLNDGRSPSVISFEETTLDKLKGFVEYYSGYSGNNIQWKLIKDTCNLYDRIAMAKCNIVEYIGLPQFLDPSSNLFPKLIDYKMYEFPADSEIPFRNFNYLCSTSSLFTNINCKLEVVEKKINTELFLDTYLEMEEYRRRREPPRRSSRRYTPPPTREQIKNEIENEIKKKFLQQTCKLTINITVPDGKPSPFSPIEIEFPMREVKKIYEKTTYEIEVDGDGPVSYISNENIVILCYFLEMLFSGEDVQEYHTLIDNFYDFSDNIYDAEEEEKSELWNKLMNSFNKFFIYTKEKDDTGALTVTVLENKKSCGITHLDKHGNIVSEQIINKGQISYKLFEKLYELKDFIKDLLLEGGHGGYLNTLKIDLIKMLYALKHTGDSGSVNFAYSLASGEIPVIDMEEEKTGEPPVKRRRTTTTTKTATLPTKPGIIFVSGDRLCISNFINICTENYKSLKMPVLCIYEGKSQVKLFHFEPKLDLSASTATTTGGSKDISKTVNITGYQLADFLPGTTLNSGDVHTHPIDDRILSEEQKRDFFSDVFMNYKTINTEDMDYYNIFDFHKTRYIGNLNYIIERKHEEWEYAGFKNKNQFDIYKSELTDILKKYDIEELNTFLDGYQISYEEFTGYSLYKISYTGGDLMAFPNDDTRFLLKGPVAEELPSYLLGRPFLEIINTGKDIEIYFKYILKNNGLNKEGENAIISMLEREQIPDEKAKERREETLPTDINEILEIFLNDDQILFIKEDWLKTFIRDPEILVKIVFEESRYDYSELKTALDRVLPDIRKKYEDIEKERGDVASEAILKYLEIFTNEFKNINTFDYYIIDGLNDNGFILNNKITAKILEDNQYERNNTDYINEITTLINEIKYDLDLLVTADGNNEKVVSWIINQYNEIRAKHGLHIVDIYDSEDFLFADDSVAEGDILVSTVKEGKSILNYDDTVKLYASGDDIPVNRKWNKYSEYIPYRFIEPIKKPRNITFHSVKNIRVKDFRYLLQNSMKYLEKINNFNRKKISSIKESPLSSILSEYVFTPDKRPEDEEEETPLKPKKDELINAAAEEELLKFPITELLKTDVDKDADPSPTDK